MMEQQEMCERKHRYTVFYFVYYGKQIGCNCIYKSVKDRALEGENVWRIIVRITWATKLLCKFPLSGYP